jgi:hypothetical protein
MPRPGGDPCDRRPVGSHARARLTHARCAALTSPLAAVGGCLRDARRDKWTRRCVVRSVRCACAPNVALAAGLLDCCLPISSPRCIGERLHRQTQRGCNAPLRPDGTPERKQCAPPHAPRLLPTGTLRVDPALYPRYLTRQQHPVRSETWEGRASAPRAHAPARGRPICRLAAVVAHQPDDRLTMSAHTSPRAELGGYKGAGGRQPWITGATRPRMPGWPERWVRLGSARLPIRWRGIRPEAGRWGSGHLTARLTWPSSVGVRWPGWPRATARRRGDVIGRAATESDDA